MSVFISIEKSRDVQFSVTMTNKDGGSITVGASDVVRIKVGRRGSTPILDLDSAAPSANGSTVSRANPAVVVLSSQDAALLNPGIYDIETALYSAADQKIKHADHGVLSVSGVMGGDVGSS